MRRGELMLCWAAIASSACARGGAGVASPDDGVFVGSSARASAEDGVDAESLPAFFTVELESDGRLAADGRRVSDLKELRERCERASSGGEFAGAALIVRGDATAESSGRVVEVLNAAGFDEVRVAFRPRVAPDSAQPPPLVESDAPTMPAAPESPSKPRSVPNSAIELKTIGLHVGGGPNDDTTRDGFRRPLEAQFERFRTCHRDAEDRERRGSFGVDLYVGAREGAPKVRDVRTALRGSRFKRCMVEAFEGARLPPGPRGPTTISYSVLFKPAHSAD